MFASINNLCVLKIDQLGDFTCGLNQFIETWCLFCLSEVGIQMYSICFVGPYVHQLPEHISYTISCRTIKLVWWVHLGKMGCRMLPGSLWRIFSPLTSIKQKWFREFSFYVISCWIFKFSGWVHIEKMACREPKLGHSDLYFDLWPTLGKMVSRAFLLTTSSRTVKLSGWVHLG